MPVRAGVFDLSIKPPEVLCIGTSALIRAIFDDQLDHSDYLDFLVRAVEAGTTPVYSGAS